MRRPRGLLGILVLVVVLALSGCGAGGNTAVSSAACSSDAIPGPLLWFQEVSLYIREDVDSLPLRGHYLNNGWDGNANVIFVNIVPNGTDLATIQWNAYQLQKMVWTSKCYTIDANWSVSVRQYANGDAYTTGTLVGSADVSEAQGYALDWAHLTPQKAWAKYDATTYHGG